MVGSIFTRPRRLTPLKTEKVPPTYSESPEWAIAQTFPFMLTDSGSIAPVVAENENRLLRS